MERIHDKTLYVTDLDGTLLNRKDRISPRSIQIINELVERGMLFTYATARSLVSASVVTEGLSTKIPVIAYNGAFIVQPSTGEILSQERFSEEEMDAVKAVLDRRRISPLVYAFVNGVEKVTWMRDQENDGIRRYLRMRKGDRRLNPISDRQMLYQGDMFCSFRNIGVRLCRRGRPRLARSGNCKRCGSVTGWFLLGTP